MGQPSPSSERPSLDAAVVADLAEDKRVDVELPGGGRLHLERRLPVLCVYRLAAGDIGTEQFVGSEPAYLIIPPAARAAAQAIKLLRTVVEQLAQHFGSFLVIEVWASPQGNATVPAEMLDGDGQVATPPFEVLTPANWIPRATIEALAKSLGRDIPPFGGTRIVLCPFEVLAPPGAKPLLRPRDCRAWNCFVLGIAVRPDFA